MTLDPTRALYANEISGLDDLPAITGIFLRFPTETRDVPFGQWLANLYNRATGATPGSGTFTFLTVPGGPSGALASSSATLPLTLLSGVEPTGQVGDPAVSIVAQSNHTGNQPILSLFNDSGTTEVARVNADGDLYLSGRIYLTRPLSTFITSWPEGGLDAGEAGQNLGVYAGDGAGASAAGSHAGGAGGGLNLSGGTGGNSDTPEVAGRGGHVTIVGGSAGTGGGGLGGNGGDIYIDGGANSGFGRLGQVLIGTQAAHTVKIGASGGTSYLGFFGASGSLAVTGLGAVLTNNVTVGGSTNVINDIPAAGGEPTAASLNDTRNAIFQLARSLKIIQDGLRAYGLIV